MRKIGKKALSLLLALVLCLGLVPVSAFAAEPTSGTCGENVTWTLNNGVLTISGAGNMKEYDFYSDVPWYSQRDVITSVVISSGVTSIGIWAFYDCGGLTNVSIPTSVSTC